jgi:RNA polymerase sigma-70 factor (ECF subfamily)
MIEDRFCARKLTETGTFGPFSHPMIVPGSLLRRPGAAPRFLGEPKVTTTPAGHLADITDWPDDKLVAEARRGGGVAFAAIMQRHNRRLYRAARGIVRNDAEAEDVVQEAYVRAYAALGDFRGAASLATWLTRIVINEALGRLRRQRDTEELDVLDRGGAAELARVIAMPGVTVAPDPEQALARAEIRRVLERAVDQLPDPFRLVFILRDVEEMSIEETAAQLGVRPETVKTRLHRARRLLRQALDERLASALTDAFPFDGARCAGVTAKVLERLRLAT